MEEPDGRVSRYRCTAGGMTGADVAGDEEARALKRDVSRAVWAVRDVRSWVRMGWDEGGGAGSGWSIVIAIPVTFRIVALLASCPDSAGRPLSR